MATTRPLLLGHQGDYRNVSNLILPQMGLRCTTTTMRPQWASTSSTSRRSCSGVSNQPGSRVDSGATLSSIYSYRGLSTQASLLCSGASPILEDQEFYDYKKWSYLEASPTRPLLSYQELLRASGPSTTPPSCEASPIQASATEVTLSRGVSKQLLPPRLGGNYFDYFVESASESVDPKKR